MAVFYDKQNRGRHKDEQLPNFNQYLLVVGRLIRSSTTRLVLERLPSARAGNEIIDPGKKN